MIVDHYKNNALYINGNTKFQKAFEFIKQYHENELPVGRYEIDGDNIYAMVQSYDTKPEAEKKWEAHKNYIDIQYIVSGKEVICWANIEDLKPNVAYNKTKDVIFFEDTKETSVKLKDGYFMLLFPEDGHKPGCILDNVEAVKKIVIKIKM